MCSFQFAARAACRPLVTVAVDNESLADFFISALIPALENFRNIKQCNLDDAAAFLHCVIERLRESNQACGAWTAAAGRAQWEAAFKAVVAPMVADNNFIQVCMGCIYCAVCIAYCACFFSHKLFFFFKLPADIGQQHGNDKKL